MNSPELRQDVSGDGSPPIMTTIDTAKDQAERESVFQDNVVRADKLLNRGDLEGALSVGEEILPHNPHYVPLLRICGIAALKCEDYNKAEKYLLTALQYDKKKPRAHHILSLLYSEKKQYAKERQHLKAILTHEPQSAAKLSADEWNYFIDSAFKLKKNNRLRDLLIKALQVESIDPKFRKSWMRMLPKLLTAKDLGVFKKAIDEAPEKHQLKPILALIYRQLGRFDDAYQLLREISTNPNSPEYLRDAFKDLSLDAHQNSISGCKIFPFFFYELLDTFPKDSFAYGEIGKRIARTLDFRSVHTETPKWKILQARDHLLTAKHLGSDDVEIPIYIADSEINLGNLKLAEELLDEMDIIREGHSTWCRIKAKLLYLQGKSTEALQWLGYFPANGYCNDLRDEIVNGRNKDEDTEETELDSDYIPRSFLFHRLNRDVLGEILSAHRDEHHRERAQEIENFINDTFPTVGKKQVEGGER